MWNVCWGVGLVDLDLDGDLDVAGSAFDGDEVAWWENNGDGSAWTKRSVDRMVDGASAVFAADVDLDGDVDLLGGSFVADRPALFLAGESGSERVTVESHQPGAAPSAGGGGSSVELTLNVNGDLGGMSGAQLKGLMKQAYIEAALEGPSIRRINARQTRRTL